MYRPNSCFPVSLRWQFWSKPAGDYEETKKMVVDILKTDDGKKAIQQVMSDEKMKSELIMIRVL